MCVCGGGGGGEWEGLTDRDSLCLLLVSSYLMPQ